MIGIPIPLFELINNKNELYLQSKGEDIALCCYKIVFCFNKEF